MSHNPFRDQPPGQFANIFVNIICLGNDPNTGKPPSRHFTEVWPECTLNYPTCTGAGPGLLLTYLIVVKAKVNDRYVYKTVIDSEDSVDAILTALAPHIIHHIRNYLVLFAGMPGCDDVLSQEVRHCRVVTGNMAPTKHTVTNVNVAGGTTVTRPARDFKELLTGVYSFISASAIEASKVTPQNTGEVRTIAFLNGSMQSKVFDEACQNSKNSQVPVYLETSDMTYGRNPGSNNATRKVTVVDPMDEHREVSAMICSSGHNSQTQGNVEKLLALDRSAHCE